MKKKYRWMMLCHRRVEMDNLFGSEGNGTLGSEEQLIKQLKEHYNRLVDTLGEHFSADVLKPELIKDMGTLESITFMAITQFVNTKDPTVLQFVKSCLHLAFLLGQLNPTKQNKAEAEFLGLDVASNADVPEAERWVNPLNDPFMGGDDEIPPAFLEE
jgi:hypothetical protein